MIDTQAGWVTRLKRKERRKRLYHTVFVCFYVVVIALLVGWLLWLLAP